MKRAATRILQALALLLALATLFSGLHDVSQAWDAWYYHLPFAARLVGLVGPDAYVFHAANQSRIEGFPLLTELLQGLCWRLTGRPEGANLVSMGSLAMYVWFLRRSLGVPLHLAFVALMAVPLIQIHATASYVDLPANAGMAALVLLVIRLYSTVEPAPAGYGAEPGSAGRSPIVDSGYGAEPGSAGRSPIVDSGYGAALRIAALAAVVANMRFQLHPLVAVTVLAAAPRLLPPLVRARDGRRLWRLALFVPLVGATFLKNVIVHHNPYYPMRLALGGLVLPGPDTPYSSSPLYLEHVPRALRFICSILEIGIRPLRDGGRWTVDQWAPWDSPALRMGGFFGAYVVFHLGLLAWTVARGRSRQARVAGVAFALLTAVVAWVPQSHELRYYLCWMMVLVSLNLWLAGAGGEDQAWKRPALGLACTGFLLVVLGATRGIYVYPSGRTFAELLRDKVDARTLGQIGEGEGVCLRREPHTFLYAAPFHPGRRYVVKEAESPEECGGYRWIE